MYDRLAKDEEEYVDSLENTQPQHLLKTIHNSSYEKPFVQGQPSGPESLDSNFSDEKPLNGRRFKKLQEKWEMLSGKDSVEKDSPPLSPTHVNPKSKIPRSESEFIL